MFDLVVIGAGPGGYVAAIRAAKLGKKVAIIDKRGFPGGTCLNVGCVPSKALLHWTEKYHEVKQGANWGLDGSALTLDWKQLQKAKEGVVDGLRKGIDGLFKANKITSIIGAARFVSPHMVEVENAQGKSTVEAENFIIATGGEPIALPFLPFDEKKVLSSTGALSLPEVPKSMIVVGAGVIGVELASVYARLGTKVTFIEQLEHVCYGLDVAIGRLLQQTLMAQGMTFHLDTEVAKAKLTEEHISLIVNEGKQSSVFNADCVLVAIGRKPYTAGLGLDEIGVEKSGRGHIFVDDQFRTKVPNVFAIGDVIEGVALAHRASEEGMAVADIIAGKKADINYLFIPNVVYTSPEVASVGLLESEAREMKIDVMVGTCPFKANSRARCSGQTEGLVKIVGDKVSGRLIGMHIIGPSASELIHEGVMALQKRAQVADIASACHAHPTLSESIREAALSAIGQPLHL